MGFPLRGRETGGGVADSTNGAAADEGNSMTALQRHRAIPQNNRHETTKQNRRRLQIAMNTNQKSQTDTSHSGVRYGIRVPSGGNGTTGSGGQHHRLLQRAAETAFRAKLAMGDTIGTLGKQYQQWKERVESAVDAFRVHLAAQEQGYQLLLRNIPQSELPLLAYEIVPLTDLLPDTETVRIRDWELPAHALFLAIGETATALHAFPFYLIEHHYTLQHRQSHPQNRRRLLGILPPPEKPAPLVASEPQAHYTCPVPGTDNANTAEPHWQPYHQANSSSNSHHRLGPPETEAALLRRLQQLYQPTPHTAHL
jgi:hypothetical protein